MAARSLRLGTRGSALARAQADLVRRDLEARNPGLAVELVLIRTTGDQLQQGPLAQVGGKGLFIKEIEEALVAGTIDCAVHSMKDVPAALHTGLVVGAIPRREDPRDVLVSHAGSLAGLAPGAKVGTASIRRRVQLLARRRDLDVTILRGNVDTRLRRWRDGDFDAILLAAAGLARLGISEPAARPLPTDVLLPAVGQGALALECRADDAATRTVLAAVDDARSAREVGAERGFLHGIGGDCNTPLAAHAISVGDRIRLRGQVSDPDGTRWLEDEVEGSADDPVAIGRALADRLLARGAGALLGR
ncbi:MAG TPA: hydroxymethylbilane synthase [Candidatus Eisenbacteria bacterium]|nr:hydroxymethylbilane synthase [Candidatus Eisenbacteria bacterium]